MTQARTSVIIPAYNAGAYLSATIRSVLASTEPVREIIVVDDGSADDTAANVRREFPQVRVIEQPNQGVAVARNTGIAHASGEWIAFVDADDIWLPGKLRAQFARLRESPQARMCYTAWEVWESAAPEPETGLVQRLRFEAEGGRSRPGPSGWIYSDLLLDCMVWTSTVLAHRSLFDEIGVFDPALHVGEDYDLWLRASRVTEIVRVDAPHALYRMHPGSITRRVPAANYKGRVVSRAIERWGYRSPDGTVADAAAVARGLARSWSDFAGAHLLAGNPGGALRAALISLRTTPRQRLGWTVLAKACAYALLPRRNAG